MEYQKTYFSLIRDFYQQQEFFFQAKSERADVTPKGGIKSKISGLGCEGVTEEVSCRDITPSI